MSRFRLVLKRFPTLADIGVLVSGTVGAQMLVLVLTPVSARLYTPEENGAFALLLAAATMIATIAGLRYELALVVEKNAAAARTLLRFVLTFIGGVGVCLTLGAYFAREWLARVFDHPELAPWCLAIGPIMVGLACVNVFNQWFTRERHFRALAWNRLQLRGGIEGAQILSALASFGGVGGLIVGQLIGVGLSASTLAWRAREALRPGRGMPLHPILREHKNMPLLNGPNALIDQVRMQGILFLIGYFFSVASVGQFSKAWLLMQAPVALVTGAISQVLFQRFSTIERGGMYAAVRRCVLGSAAAAALPFLVLLVVAPVLFPWYLGARWEVAGYMAQALVPWLFMNVMSSPISTVYVVVRRQGLMLAFASAYLAVGCACLVVGAQLGLSLLATVWVLSLAMAACLGGLIAVTFRVARSYDAAAWVA